MKLQYTLTNSPATTFSPFSTPTLLQMGINTWFTQPFPVSGLELCLYSHFGDNETKSTSDHLRSGFGGLDFQCMLAAFTFRFLCSKALCNVTQDVF